jgi:hypothetical protein
MPPPREAKHSPVQGPNADLAFAPGNVDFNAIASMSLGQLKNFIRRQGGSIAGADRHKLREIAAAILRNPPPSQQLHARPCEGEYDARSSHVEKDQSLIHKINLEREVRLAKKNSFTTDQINCKHTVREKLQFESKRESQQSQDTHSEDRNQLNLEMIVKLLEDGEALHVQDKDLILFLGETGTGKSTTINWLAGSNMARIPCDPPTAEQAPSRRKSSKVATVIEAYPAHVKIGHGKAASETRSIKQVQL